MTEWIDVKDELPSMYRNVIVWGVRPKENICHQLYQARRWTGLTGHPNRDAMWEAQEGDELCCWDWATPCDYSVVEVKFWMPFPEIPREPITNYVGPNLDGGV